ncbi:MAG: MBL fold metallo-hydrolase [Verrucomicrobia bacterium]|nr:MAG: MBL fold metallo-hydrolase [Verrucomicrobiota bacterium]
MKLEFWGGADTVTGSQLLIRTSEGCLLRDCGLFQGRRKTAWDLNSRIPYPVKDLHACIISHAHIDHLGNLPTLVKSGYDRPIWATGATMALAEIMLMDAAHIQEQDAAYLNQKKSRRGLPPVRPLYTVENAEQCLQLFRGQNYHQVREPLPGMEVEPLEAGHILGAALHRFRISENGRTITLGVAVDLGRRGLPLIRDPEILHDVDILIMESTYGGRLHDAAEDARTELRDVVRRTIDRGGKVLIPTFALERAQELLFHLSSLIESGELEPVPVYVDSPMATAVTRVFQQQREYLDEEYWELRGQLESVMSPPWVHFVSSVEESKQVTASDSPCIVIAGSGMCEHGRILHHLKHGIEDPRNAIVIVGFQAQHTLGRRIVERVPEVSIFGEKYRLLAEVATLNAFSAHADRDELVQYARATGAQRVILVHGEPDQRDSLAEVLQEMGIEVVKPMRGTVLEIP